MLTDSEVCPWAGSVDRSSAIEVRLIDLEARLVVPATELLEPALGFAGRFPSRLEAPHLGCEPADLAGESVLAVDQFGPPGPTASAPAEHRLVASAADAAGQPADEMNVHGLIVTHFWGGSPSG